MWHMSGNIYLNLKHDNKALLADENCTLYLFQRERTPLSRLNLTKLIKSARGNSYQWPLQIAAAIKEGVRLPRQDLQAGK